MMMMITKLALSLGTMALFTFNATESIAYADEEPAEQPTTTTTTTTTTAEAKPPSEEAPPKDEPPPSSRPLAKSKWSTPIGFRVDGGYSARKLLELPVSGADMGVAAGAQPVPFGAFWGATRIFIGSTENGLKVFSLRAGPDAEAVFGRLRIGVGVNVFLVGIGRAVRNETIYSWGPAMQATSRFDLVQSSTFALFVRAAIDVGIELSANSAYWGPTIGVGMDLDLIGERKR